MLLITLLYLVFVIFFFGMLLATASNDKIIWPFIPLHALWHLVSAYGFIVLWAFNHVRFAEFGDGLKHVGDESG